MNGDKRNFSLSIWDHKDNFICNLKSANLDFEGQSFDENFTENINGEKTLSFSIPMYIFSYDENEKNKFNFERNNPWNQNEAWKQIKNEQKIRYIEYHPITNKPIRIEEFVLKEFTESRNEEEKIANCVCESLATYELGKVGWGITFDTNYISNYELSYHEEEIDGINTKVSNCPDLLTIDYWMKKLLYKETNLGRVSNTTECTYLLQGLQLRDDEGYPINSQIISVTTNIDDNAEYKYERIEEPIASTTDLENYLNETGWYWEVKANFENDPEKQSVSTLYEAPVINQFIETYPNYYVAQSYQKGINSNSTEMKQLRRHPIEEDELNDWTYVTDIKKRLITEERSNLFSIIQDLCETFQVWADFQYHYNDSGKIDQRKILFKTESIDEDVKFDFSYGKNLQSISRINNSNDLVTKLYVANTESNLIDGNILSIQQATANPTGENYIYNFDYFYDSGLLTRENQFDNEHIEDSDEYQINLYYGKLRNINNKIINTQKYLTPLYDRQNTLEGDLSIEEGSKIGYIDNIQSIQDKIDAIPPNDQLIKSWSDDTNQYNHVGELKTYSNTTNPNNNKDTDWYYLNFGREDVIVKNIRYYKYNIIENENGLIDIEQIDTGITTEGFIPRVFKYGGWYSGTTEALNKDFINFSQTTSLNIACEYDYSSIGNKSFIKGIYFKKSKVENATYGRIRYKYAPLAYYYLLINDYWKKIKKVNTRINKLNKNLTTIKNKIILYELQLKKLLKEKNELILQFENKYKPFIREGYWEPSDYQSEYFEQTFNTFNDEDNFNYLRKESVELSTLKLNDSLSTYSYYFSLGKADEIDIDSIEVRVKTDINGVTTYIPHYQGNNYELYLSGSNLICAIDPEFINNSIKKYNPIDNSDFFESEVSYRPIIDEISQSYTTKIFSWTTDPIYINNYKIYLNNENIITNKLKVYGDEIDNEELNLLIPYEDYSYTYESVGYDKNNEWVDLSQQSSYSKNIQYKYSLCIDLKLTNNTLKFLAEENPVFIVNYGEETTLQYIYNDAIATSKKYSTPQVEYDVSVVDLSSLNEYEKYIPKLGQKVPIFDPEMNFYNFKGFITSIDYPLEEKYNTRITIATYNTKFEDIFQKLTATMTNVSYNSNQIYQAANSFESNGAIKTDVFNKSLKDNFKKIELGTDNSISIDKTTGITLTDNETNAGVKLLGNGIFLTQDITKNEDTEWKTGITGEGINASALTAGNIDTKQITIWNSSERQARFIWNEQGLFAYGDYFGESESTSASTYQELINYNKYVKFNQNGLEFNDNETSALSLGWQGLKIQAQNEALELNATEGLILKQWNNDHTNFTTRLELGKLDGNNLYGLRLKDPSGLATVQNDSEGNLWLHQHIKVGGSLNNNNKIQNPTAGIYGLNNTIEETVPVEMQMGIRRDNNGNVIWDSTPIRFWAGPQTIPGYKDNIHISDDEINNSNYKDIIFTYLNNPQLIKNNESPTLAKFKVSANGDIIASGIDVGGWIGEGEKLRSFNNEAILRSNGYDSNFGGNNYPLIAIGKQNDTNYGSDYNFKVYQDGSLNIGNGVFIVDKDGNVYANSLSITTGQVIGLSEIINDLELDEVGGYQNNNSGSDKGLKFDGQNYYIGLMSPNALSDVVFFAGTISGQKNKRASNEFYIKADGSVTAKKLTIVSDETDINNTSLISVKDNKGVENFSVTRSGTLTAKSGTIGGWQIAPESLFKANGNYITSLYPRNSGGNLNTNPVFYIGNKTITDANTKFKITADGSIYFAGNIYAWYNSKFIKCLDSAEILSINNQRFKFIKGLAVSMN